MMDYEKMTKEELIERIKSLESALQICNENELKWRNIALKFKEEKEQTENIFDSYRLRCDNWRSAAIANEKILQKVLDDFENFREKLKEDK